MKISEALIIAGISAAVSVGVALSKGDANEKRVEKLEVKQQSLEVDVVQRLVRIETKIENLKR